MSGKVYALLVGINDYRDEIGKLSACISDVEDVHDFLKSTYKKSKLEVEKITDHDAICKDVIKGFKKFLTRAKKGDTALFYFSGHGAQWKSAKQFNKYFPDGKDEGLVLYDSRLKADIYDLADKELAVLLQQIAKNDPHLAVILDCCHAGSGTRSVDDVVFPRARQTHERSDARPLESYLGGYYDKLFKKNQDLLVPACKHISLAACDRKEKAWEGSRGIFTVAMTRVLRKYGGNISYADLFVQTRAEVRRKAQNQHPQFESYGNFSAFSGFLGADAAKTAPRFSVYYERKKWHVEAGAVHGLSTDPTKPATFNLYREDTPTKISGSARATVVAAQKSDLELDFDSSKSKRYFAEITSLPLPPIPVYLTGEKKAKRTIQNVLKSANKVTEVGIEFVDNDKGCDYGLIAAESHFELRRLDTGDLLQKTRNASANDCRGLISPIRKIVHWERMLNLKNDHTQLKSQNVDFYFTEKLPDGKRHRYEEDEIVVDYVQDGNNWQDLLGELSVANNTGQKLHMACFVFWNNYAIYKIANEQAPKKSNLILWDDANGGLSLSEGEDEFTFIYKLYVSTEKIDDFAITGPEEAEKRGITLGATVGSTRAGMPGVKVEPQDLENEWFTKTLKVKLVRRKAVVGGKDVSVANNKVTIKKHKSVKGNITMSRAAGGTRSVGGGAAMQNALAQMGMSMVSFGGTRSVGGENVLEISDIENSGDLRDDPLEIELNAGLKKDEYLLPMAFNGQHMIFTGAPQKGTGGKVTLKIDYIPESTEKRRSLGKALKLYFFKTYLRRKDVNELSWVTFDDEGKPKRNKRGVAKKVAEARKILVVIHGIIGNTDSITIGLPNSTLKNGKRLSDHFDLVLAFDYENLSTPINETSVDLIKKLKRAGISKNKKVTILAHSMGGLVSRWAIERAVGGAELVEHLVMCGTPNGGSPFGKLDTGRLMLSALTTVAINYIPGIAPAGAAIVFLLNRTKKITPTLEMMNPDSFFIKTLNESDDPKVRYSILAGNVDDYNEPSDHLFPKLLDSIYKGMLLNKIFKSEPHDVAVGLKAIGQVNRERKPAPAVEEIACHHLNYFISRPGLKALGEVKW